MNNLSRIKKIIQESSNLLRENPFLDKLDALKKAYALVKSEEEKVYSPNGGIVEGPIGTHSSADWTY